MKKCLLCLIGFLMLTGCTPVKYIENPVFIPAGIPTRLVAPSNTIAPIITPDVIPTKTPNPYPPVNMQISAGDYHTCFLSSSGKVMCWGWNQFGQAGPGSNPGRVEPGEWINLTGIIQISSGGYHTCAVDVEHRVFCWGRNNMGQLGNGETTDSNIPVQVVGLSGININSVVSGSLHTCAYESHGNAWCWGSNRDGKLGSGIKELFSANPILVSNPVQNVISLSAGATFTCAVGETGPTWCWGDGSFGQTGNRLKKSSSLPNEITKNIPDIYQITSGWFHTCALTTLGDVFCWGKNYEGELGNSSTVSNAEPVIVNMGRDDNKIRLLSAGGRTTCAVTIDNRVYCWGKNDYGQIGNGNTKDQLMPIQNTSEKDTILSISVGASHA